MNNILQRLKNIIKRFLLINFFIPSPFKETFIQWEGEIDTDTLLIAIYASIIPIKMIEVDIDELFIINETTLPLDDFLREPDGTINRSILNSPHYKLLEIYKNDGLAYLKENYKDTDYYKMIKYFSEKGKHFSLIAGSFVNKKRKDSDDYIWYKISRIISVYENIKKVGYLGVGHEKKFISVLDKPIYITRFSKDFPWKPYEMLFGHHRAAAIAASGITRVKVILFNDAAKRADYTIFNQWWGKYKLTKRLCEYITGMPVNEECVT
ncbi:MAG: hypothetical protein HQK91_09600 [Nitrospirae bacterium]|nr:hypothetical protein [Nitrospirota bacterium]MBF0541687.1 hypothetical protein [Nitrospirota bacterium]